MTLWIQEEFVNETKGFRFASGSWVETAYDAIGDLFRSLAREYGRCISRVYVGDGEPVGWTFEKRVEYDDAARIADKAARTYIRHVWVSVSTVAPVTHPCAVVPPVSPWSAP